MELSSEILDNLSEEMRQRVAACETPEDLVDLAEAEGVDLTPEQLKMVAGGEDSSWDCVYAPCYI